VNIGGLEEEAKKEMKGVGRRGEWSEKRVVAIDRISRNVKGPNGPSWGNWGGWRNRSTGTIGTMEQNAEKSDDRIEMGDKSMVMSSKGARKKREKGGTPAKVLGG